MRVLGVGVPRAKGTATHLYPEREPSAPAPLDLDTVCAAHPTLAESRASVALAGRTRQEAADACATLQAQAEGLHRIRATPTDAADPEAVIGASYELESVQRTLRLAAARLERLQREEMEAGRTWHRQAQAVLDAIWVQRRDAINVALERAREVMSAWAQEEQSFIAGINAASPPGQRFSVDSRVWVPLAGEGETALAAWRRAVGLEA